MPAFTYAGPQTHAQTKAVIGLAHTFALEQTRQAMVDSLDPRTIGLLSLRGDVAGSRSEVIRVTDVDGIGFALPMQAMGSEVDTVAPAPITLGYEEVTVGMYGLAMGQSFKQQALNGDPELTLERLLATLPQSWLRTVRQLMCAVGAGFSQVAGSTSTALSFDDYLDLLGLYRTTAGAGRPITVLDGVQMDQLVRSARNEPGMQSGGVADAGRVMGVAGRSLLNWLDLGGDIHLSDDVVQSGGARQGFSTSEGGIGWGRANTAPITAVPAESMYMPEFGLILTPTFAKNNSRVSQWDATAFLGVAAGSARVYKQARLVSVI